MGDFNINLLHAKTSCYAQDFLLSLQSFSFIPTIDKPARVYNKSATLIDNILTKLMLKLPVGISDKRDHHSQFCISDNSIQRPRPGKQKRGDFSCYSRSKFNSELSDALVSQTNSSDQFDVNTAFSYFYNTLFALVDKHAPLKTISNRMNKQFSKPWITSALKKYIKTKNSILQSGDLVNYKISVKRIIIIHSLLKIQTI